MKVFITGSSAHLARALLPRLCAHPAVTQVTGIDIRAAHFTHAKFSPTHLDIRAAQLANHMENHNILINMAFRVLRGRMSEAAMSDVNINGGQNVFRAARAAGITRLIHLSSAAVYGSGENLNEDTPLAPLPGFLYGQHKARLERWLAAEFPQCARLRPHAILGPNAQPLLKWLLRQPCHLRLPEPAPRLQCVHEDDVAEAVLLAMQSAVRGPLNLATADSFSFRDAIRARHRVSVPLPVSMARATLSTAWKISGWGGEPAWIDGLTRNLTLDCRRAQAELGWRSSCSAAQALAQT
ncbi:MAG: NAD-dependent epimerase/dehydratase family protein [Pseudomonadota bacterium]